MALFSSAGLVQNECGRYSAMGNSSGSNSSSNSTCLQSSTAQRDSCKLLCTKLPSKSFKSSRLRVLNGLNSTNSGGDTQYGDGHVTPHALKQGQSRKVHQVERSTETDESPWSFEEDVLNELTAMSSTLGDQHGGLGITQFLKDKRILITGATGFLGKVLVEKILRAQPDVGKLYLLINADTPQKANHRLLSDVQDSGLFQVLRQKHGPQFNKFMQDKLVAIAGKVERSDLGIDEQTRTELSNKLDIVVNSSATTNFFERYDVALNINTKGPLNLLEFAKKCPQLQLFLHISTAYVNGTRQGRVFEAPFAFGQSIAKETLGDEAAPRLDVWKEIESVKNHSGDDEAMKQLGMQRAGVHGWQDTYVFTKAMGEMLINQAKGDLPVVILRPAVVEGTLAQPFGGWIQGTRMMDPILLAYGRGHLHAFYADPDCVLDVVPADMVVNSVLAAMSHHAGRGAGLEVYQVGSSAVNPLTFQKLANYSMEHFRSKPFLDQSGHQVLIPNPILHSSRLGFALHCFINYGLPIQLAKFWGSKHLRKHAKRTEFLAKRVEQLVETYSSYTFYKGRFDISNTRRLYDKMSPEEKEEFGFDIRSINWDDYIKNVHLPGLRKYHLGDANSTFRPISVKEYIQGVLTA